MKQKYYKYTDAYILFLEKRNKLNSTIRRIKNKRGISKGYYKTVKDHYEDLAKKIKKLNPKDAEKILGKIVMNNLIEKEINKLIGEVKCLPV